MKPPLTLSDIDAISGATVTSTAVVNAINTVYAQLTGEASTAAPAEEEAPAAQLYEDGTWRAAFKGFGGPVMVALTLDDNLTIQSIQIGDDQFAETLRAMARRRWSPRSRSSSSARPCRLRTAMWTASAARP